MERPNNPHDRFFKEVLGNVANTQAFLETYLPPDVLQTIDVGTIQAEKDSFIEQDLKEFYADLLFRANIRNREAYVYILLEHKSYSDYNVGVQLLRYMSAIWDKEIKKQKNRRLPLILPIVLYQGKEKWGVSTQFADRIEGVETMEGSLRESIPHFKYYLYDFSSNSGEEIKGPDDLRLYLETIRMASIKDPEKFNEAYVRITTVFVTREETETSERLYDTFIHYLYYLIAREDFLRLVQLTRTVSVERSERMQTIAEWLKQEGMEKGLEEGMLRGLERGIEVGREQLLWKQISKKFPQIPRTYYEKLKTLTIDQLDNLGLELMDMQNVEELKKHLHAKAGL